MWEIPATRWEFPDPTRADGEVVAIGGDLETGTVLHAYTRGIFPMPLEGQLAWWSPDPRGIIPLDGLRVSRSLRKSCRRYEIRIDTAFDEVIAACADPTRPHGWIDHRIMDAYRRLHREGWVHSVEAWDWEDGELAGGLYGVAIGGLFAGESMFHRRTDASKAALVGLVELLNADQDGTNRLLDVQWATDHLRSLGAVEVPRKEYVNRVKNVIRTAPLSAFGTNIRNRP
jgi:leucyl/phenylalanyl-tRNA---protein transferase